MKLKPKILLIIPCYNEASNIKSLLREIKSHKSFDSLVIDDGSSDNTASLALQETQCLQLPINLGIGGAVQTGIKYAYQNHYDFCIQIDGDGQHPPDQIEHLLHKQVETQADLVIGSRFIKNDSFNSSWSRRIGIRVISLAIKILFEKKITDPTSGMRLINQKAMKLFSKHYPTDFPEPISLCHALENKLKIVEVSVKMRAREYGHSSIAGFKNLSYMIRVLGYMILTRLSRSL